jgi:hypothetical protein
MPLRIIFFMLIFSARLVSAQSENSQKSWLAKFFSSVPPPAPKSDQPGLPAVGSEKWELRPIVTIPALKITESTREDAKVDVFLLTSTGGGISYQHLKYDDEKKKWYVTFSWSLPTVLLSGNLSADNPVDFSVASTVGFYNNLIMLGGGYDLGAVKGRSRWFGVLSIGINLNNNL